MIRRAAAGDLESIANIYNQAIESKFQTGFTEKFGPDALASWLDGHMNERCPVFVHTEDSIITGWFSISPYRPGRDAFRYTVEISCFIHTDYQRHGIGRHLMDYGINICRELGYKVVLGIIINKNTASYKLAEKLGFERWGALPGVGNFDGEECDHYYYGLKLKQA